MSNPGSSGVAMPRVYLETSFVSACVTQRRDLESQYRRAKSREWWTKQAPKYELYASLEVIDELASPGHRQRDAALKWIEAVPLLEINQDVLGLARVLVSEKAMPSPARGDALHVAVTAVWRVDYLLSWNVRHLANVNKKVHLQRACARCGYTAPEILTPDLLWETIS